MSVKNQATPKNSETQEGTLKGDLLFFYHKPNFYYVKKHLQLGQADQAIKKCLRSIARCKNVIRHGKAIPYPVHGMRTRRQIQP